MVSKQLIKKKDNKSTWQLAVIYYVLPCLHGFLTNALDSFHTKDMHVRYYTSAYHTISLLVSEVELDVRPCNVAGH